MLSRLELTILVALDFIESVRGVSLMMKMITLEDGLPGEIFVLVLALKKQEPLEKAQDTKPNKIIDPLKEDGSIKQKISNRLVL